MLKNIQSIFIGVTFFALVILAYNGYSAYSFKNNPLSTKYLLAIEEEEMRVLKNMKQNYGFSHRFPLIVTDKIPGKVFGVTSLEDNGKIRIYLNKKVMRESFEYVISDVIAHEYAHALLFKNGYYQNGGEGHSNVWRKICVKLGGAQCRDYVNSHKVIMGKLPF